ncbi:MAG: type II CRISPR-associated endonuclease Cas1 [Lactobacillaceae bacterium]|jgi:CRISPR-associated protein Cas1|nr:type II CRISPR-associated endonuclease Cas1 [Lactobacillaceae bacterium]
MTKQIIVIESAQKVSYSKSALVIEKDNEITHYPLHSIQSLIFETDHNSVTISALHNLANDGIPVFFCDYRHLPCSAVLSTNVYYERANRIELQFNAGAQFKKRLWQKIIRQKIMNQATVTYGFSIPTAIHLKQLIKLVDPGDTALTEAVAARIYFQTIVHEHFSRRSDAPLNYFFNYGYAVVRSLITQRLMAHGLEPSIGIWHHGQRNSLNLTYDLIEAFRPFVDSRVLALVGEAELTKANRTYLLQITDHPCIIGDQKTTLQQAINLCIDSFVHCLETNSTAALLLPRMVD